jgi:hypothetical protein
VHELAAAHSIAMRRKAKMPELVCRCESTAADIPVTFVCHVDERLKLAVRKSKQSFKCATEVAFNQRHLVVSESRSGIASAA